MKLPSSLLASVLVSPLTRRSISGWHEARRRFRRRPHRIVFYHRVTDAWSWLLAQLLPRVLQQYEVELETQLVAALPIDCVSDPQRLDNYSAYDAMRLARAWQLRFPDAATPPAADLAHLAGRVILAQPQSLSRLLQATAAAWDGDSQQLAAMARDDGAADEQTTAALLGLASTQLARQGHYLGAMLYFQGEWFWGLDRLGLLEQRLAARGLRRNEEPPVSEQFQPIERQAAGMAQALDLEFYFSFRSPYSWLGACRVVELADRLGLNLQLRPLLPMVMRGIPVPRRKLRYIITDVARIARRDNIPFGPVRDPLGKGVERALAVFDAANRRDRGRDFMLAAMRAIWCQAADLTSTRTLNRLAAVAGLDAAEVEQALQSNSWRAGVEANAAALAVLGIWGVPAMCLRDPDARAATIAWGQDRMWAIERAALGIDVAMPPPRLVQ
ncbi:MAG: 2-hydroxychromene-2-carboxylate dehydrogenase [Gammaproteobacteria bacterium]|nr:2-hydroxychromene-2-carboxylate dehydrogenase [Gammaproteobacteria bacterium]